MVAEIVLTKGSGKKCDQIEKIKKHASGVSDLRSKLKYWDYMEVLKVHEALESVNESINSLGLVPQGF